MAKDFESAWTEYEAYKIYNTTRNITFEEYLEEHKDEYFDITEEAIYRERRLRAETFYEYLKNRYFEEKLNAE
jgi:hypothetical protein